MVTVAFLEVGHGDSIVIIYPDGRTATVVDTPNSKVTFDFIDRMKIQQIDWVIVSHGDIDHYKGVASLINNLDNQGIRVSKLGYIGGDKRIDKSYRDLLRNFLEFEDYKGIETINPFANVLPILANIDNMLLRCIYPQSPSDVVSAAEKSNNWSIVILVEYQGLRVLLPGDLEGEGWFRLYNRLTRTGNSLKADVFKIPHHGRWFSRGGKSLSLKDVIMLVNASVSVLSIGYHERLACPSSRVIRALKESPANPRILCTGSGKTCHNGKPLRYLPKGISLGQSRYLETNPCAGNILVKIKNNKLYVSPSPPAHAEVIAQLSNPSCVNNTSSQTTV